MLRTQIYLPKSQLDALRVMAHQEQTTVSDITRKLLDLQLHIKASRPQHKVKVAETFVNAARRISKMGSGGPRDLALNHDYYLYGTPKKYKHIR